jgi:hypothetical protein
MTRKRHHRSRSMSAKRTSASSSYGREIDKERKALAKFAHKDIKSISKLTHGRKRSALGRAW